MFFSRKRTNRECVYTYYFGYAGMTSLLLLESDQIVSINEFGIYGYFESVPAYQK